MRSKDIWHYISLEMQAQGYVSCVAKSQCETKFKNFTRAYTACIDRISKTGNDAKKCAYYEELHGIFHGDDNIKPPAVFSSRKELVKRGKEGTEKSTERGKMQSALKVMTMKMPLRRKNQERNPQVREAKAKLKRKRKRRNRSCRN